MEDGNSFGTVSLTVFYPQNHMSLKKGKGNLINWCSAALSIERDRRKRKRWILQGTSKGKDFQQNSKTFFNMFPAQEKNGKILELIWHGKVILTVLFLSRHLFAITFQALTQKTQTGKSVALSEALPRWEVCWSSKKHLKDRDFSQMPT